MTSPLFQKLKRKIERNLLGRDPLYNDPYDDPGEQFYARIYLKYLFQVVDAEFRRPPVKILDIGCHTGRLSIPLARAGHRVTAVDTSRFHIRRAQAHAHGEGVRVHFVKADGFRFLRCLKPESFDFVLCTEVLYQLPDFRERMEELLTRVRPGGILATSHRTRFFYLSQALVNRDFETVRRVLDSSEGEVGGSYFNWQMPEELKALYRQLGLDLLLLRPVGALTGNGHEAMARLCNVSEISDSQKEHLIGIEAADSDEFACLGRYLLAIGRKREG